MYIVTIPNEINTEAIQDGHQADISNFIFLCENCYILIKVSLKLIHTQWSS